MPRGLVCGHKLRCEHVGKNARCPQCNSSLPLPTANEAAKLIDDNAWPGRFAVSVGVTGLILEILGWLIWAGSPCI